MRTNNIVLLLLTVAFLGACSSDNEEAPPKFQLKKAKNNVQWTAYKTTDKIAVDGSFETVTMVSNSEGNTIKEAIQDAEFSLPIADLLAGGKEYNIIEFFFGAMINPNVITGKILLTNDKSGYIELTMGGVTENLMFDYTLKENQFTMTAIMDLDKWKVERALEALNNVCKLVHSGGDGIAKVWNNITIKANIDFNEVQY